MRARKHREEKALAVMVRDVDAARRIAQVRPPRRRCSPGPQRPIVLLEKRRGAPLAPSVAPRSKYYGVMLPYTPVHHLLMEGPYAALVMTSGNATDEPIAKDNEEAVERLGRHSGSTFCSTTATSACAWRTRW